MIKRLVVTSVFLAGLLYAGFTYSYPGGDRPIRLTCDTLDRPSTVLVLWTDSRVIVGDQGSYRIDVGLTTDRTIVAVDATRFVTLYIGEDRIVLQYRGRESVCRVKNS